MDVCLHGGEAVLRVGLGAVALHAVLVVAEVIYVLREGGARRRRQTGVCAAVFLVEAETLHAFEVFLLTDLKLLALVSVVGDVGLSEVDEAELVLGIELRAERRFESRSARATAEWIGDVVFRSDGIDCSTEGEFVFFVLSRQRWQRRKLGPCGDGDNRLKRR